MEKQLLVSYEQIFQKWLFFKYAKFLFAKPCKTFVAVNDAEISFKRQFGEVWQPLLENNDRFPTFLPYSVFMAAHFMVMIGSCL